MANLGRNIEEEKEYLKLQEQIRDAQKEAGKSLQNAGQYTKTIAANYLEMKKLTSKIKDLEEEMLTADKERAAAISQQVEELKKERDQIKAINKEMASLGGVVRAGFSGLISYLGQALTGYLEFSQKTKDVAANIGLGSNNMWMMQQNVQLASAEMLRYGVNLQDALAAQEAYSEELGRTVILSTSALENMAQIGKATGLGMQGMAGLTAQMDAFGLGAEQSAGMIYDMYSESAAMGLNAGKVIKKFEQNIGLLNKLNFKNGIKGLQKMTQLSEKYKIDMNEVASASAKAFSPEGAIDMAAQLQTLGGSLAGLGDPFQLMYKARNNPEKFAEDIAKAASQSAVFNKQTGEFEVGAMEMDRLRVAADATGQSMESLVATAKQTAKINMFKNLLGGKGLSPEEQDAVAMMTEMKDGKAQIQMGFGPDAKPIMKDITSLNKDELQKVLNDKKSAKEAAEQATGISERWTNFLNQLQTAVYPLFMAIEKYFTESGIFTKLSQWGTDFAKSITTFLSTVDFSSFINDIKSFFVGLWEKLKWIGEHWKLALGVAATIFVGSWVGAQVAAGVVFGRTAGAAFKMASGGGGIGGGGTDVTQQASGMSALGSAAGTAIKVIAFAAAIYILAQALKVFNEVEWSSLVKGGIAIVGFGLSLQFMGPILDEFSAEAIAAIPAMIGLGAAIVLLGAGLFLMGQVPLANLIVGFLGLVGVLLAFSLLAPVLAVGELVLLGLGAAFLMIGVAVAIAALGMSVLVDSFTGMFTVIGANGAGLFMAGLGFLALAAGIGILTISLMAMGAAALFALPGLLILGSVTSMLTETASALASSGGGEGIAKAVNAINSVDESKLEALKDLSMWMALVGASPTIKFDESLTIDGSIEISGQSGGKSNTDWIKDPIFVSKLKEMIASATEADKRGGKA